VNLARAAIALKRGIRPVGRASVGAQFLELLPGFRGRVVGIDMKGHGGEGTASYCGAAARIDDKPESGREPCAGVAGTGSASFHAKELRPPGAAREAIQC